MTEQLKEVTNLNASDFAAFPIWEFAIDLEAISDTLVRPVVSLPVDTLTGRLIGTQVRLANGDTKFAVLGNIDLASARKTGQFLDLAIDLDGEWLHLARYFDIDCEDGGPLEFAARLGLPVSSVFPIHYDIRPYCVGDPGVVMGTILAEPLEQLSEEERISLAVNLKRPSA